MKQHIIIIFSVNPLTRFKTNLCLSYKTNMVNMQDSFSKYSILAGGRRLGIVRIEVYIHIFPYLTYFKISS